MCPNENIKLTDKTARKLVKRCLSALAEGVMLEADNVVGRVRKIKGRGKKRSIATYDLFYNRDDNGVLLKVEYDTPTNLSTKEQHFHSMATFARAYGVNSVTIPRVTIPRPDVCVSAH